MCTPYIMSNVMRPIKERKTNSEIKSYEKTKIEMELELKFIKAGIQQLNNILEPEKRTYDFSQADDIIRESKAILATLNNQLRVMEGKNNG